MSVSLSSVIEVINELMQMSRVMFGAKSSRVDAITALSYLDHSYIDGFLLNASASVDTWPQSEFKDVISLISIFIS